MKKKMNVKVVLLIQVLFLAIGFLWAKGVNAGFHTGLFGLFFDLADILCMMCFVVPGIFITGIGKDLMKSFSVGQKDYSLLELKSIYEALKGFQKLIRLGASLVGIIALVWCLQNAAGDVLEIIGPCLVICLLPAFYALVIDYLLLPLIINTQRQINEVMAADEED